MLFQEDSCDAGSVWFEVRIVGVRDGVSVYPPAGVDGFIYFFIRYVTNRKVALLAVRIQVYGGDPNQASALLQP